MWKHVLVAALLVTSAGCARSNQSKPWELQVEPVESVPSDAVVLAHDNATIADVGPLQTALDDAANASDGAVTRRLSTAKADRVRKALGKLPSHESDDGTATWYVRHDGQTYAVQVVRPD